MGGVSNVGPTGSNSGDSTRIVVSGKKEEAVINAFESYRQFKQQAENEYKNYNEEVQKEFEEFRNKVSKEYNSFRENADDKAAFNKAYAKALENPDNWHEYEVHEGIKLPVMNKPTTAPVYRPENRVNSAQIMYDELVTDHEPVYYNEDSHVKEPATEPSAEVKNNAPAVSDEKPSQTKPQSDEKPVLKQVSRNGVSGGYNISAGKDGSGFSLQTNMKVTMLGEARKFFSPEFGEIKRDENGYYNYRGIKSKNYNIVTQKVQSTSIQVSSNNAIYNDLLSKKNSGTELTEAEESFIKFHLNNIQRYGLGVDKNGNLVEKQ